MTQNSRAEQIRHFYRTAGAVEASALEREYAQLMGISVLSARAELSRG